MCLPDKRIDASGPKDLLQRQSHADLKLDDSVVAGTVELQTEGGTNGKGHFSGIQDLKASCGLLGPYMMYSGTAVQCCMRKDALYF